MRAAGRGCAPLLREERARQKARAQFEVREAHRLARIVRAVGVAHEDHRGLDAGVHEVLCVVTRSARHEAVGGTLGFGCLDEGVLEALIERDRRLAVRRRDLQSETLLAGNSLHRLADEGLGTLEAVRRLLGPNGRLVVEVPNFGSWQARLGGPDWFHIDVPRHLLHFDRRALEGVLERAGFVVERRHTFSLEYDAFGLLQTILNKLCEQPNHLFQTLIGRPHARSVRDGFIDLALGAPLAALSIAISIAAPLFGQGGVLRMVARPRGA